MSNKVNQAQTLDEKDLEITPQARHKQKLIEEQESRKKNLKRVDEWYEIYPDTNHKNGGKVSHCIRLSNGNLHRLYMGREKQVADILRKKKSKGMRVQFAQPKL